MQMGCRNILSSYWRTLFKGVRHMTIKNSLFFFLASYHGLVDMALFLCFSIACSLIATKTVYAPFAFHMDVTYYVGVGD